MALQFSTANRNAMLAAIANTMSGSEVIKIWTGGVPANCAAADTGTLLVTFSLATSNDWGTPTAGTITLSGLPISANAGNTGTAGYFRHYDGSGNCHMQGTVSATGGGGNLTLGSTTITSGQQQTLSTYNLTAPGV